MPTFYLDYENGNDAADGSTFALGGLPAVGPWKTITTGATAARIAPGDIIRIAKSPAPAGIGTATWNNLSKTVTLDAAQTLNVDLCEVAWTGANGGVVVLTPVATTAKEGANCMKVTSPAAPAIGTKYAYHATGALNLAAYQKLSFWFHNQVAVLAGHWKICLCSDAIGDVIVDTFLIPAVPSLLSWLPLTLARVGGGNLGANINSIALYSNTVAPTANKYVYLDDFIACTTNGLNLQSLISKNLLEQGGAEAWYGIQSINGVTVLIDNDTNTKADAGKGYSGVTELVATYIRETTKTAMAAISTTAVQEVQDSGTLVGGNIQFQGGYDTALNTQIGETFFDGLNSLGYGIYLNTKSYITLNYLNVTRYNSGVYFISSNNNVITTLSNANNNTNYGVYFGASNNNVITTLSNANNNNYGVYFTSASNNNVITTLSNANNNNNCGVYFFINNNNVITTLSNANNNTNSGVYFNSSNNHVITTLSNANNNNSCGVYFDTSNNNVIRALSTTGNAAAGVFNDKGINYLNKAAIAEATEVTGAIAFCNSRIYSQWHDLGANNHWIFTDGGLINSEANTRPGGLGLEWKLAISSANRYSGYPLCLSIAKFAVTAGNLVTFRVYLTKSHAANIAGYIVCKGGQIAGVPADVVATKANDVNPEQLTITFTPTEAGTVEIMACAYYVAANGNVLVDTISIAQA